MKYSVALLLVFVAVSFAALRSSSQLRYSLSPVKFEGKKDRKFEVKVDSKSNAREVRLKGRSIQATAEENSKNITFDAVEFEFDTKKKVDLDFAYYHAEAQVSDDFNVSSIGAAAFQFLFRSLFVFEYNEVNNIAGFQNGTDVILRKYDLTDDKLEWNPIQISSSNVTDDQGNTRQVWFIEAETSDEVFYIRFIVTGTPVDVGGVVITPDSCKVDFKIRWFTPLHVPADWTDGPTSSSSYPNSQVGLATAFGAKVRKAKHENQGGGFSKNQPQFTFQADDDSNGYFTWISTADVIVGGVEAAQNVSVDVIDVTDNKCCKDGFSGDQAVLLAYYSFNGVRPTEVAWDPEFGSNIDYPVDESSATIKMATAFLVVFLAILL